MNLYYDKAFYIILYKLTLPKHIYTLVCVDLYAKITLQYHAFMRNYCRIHTQRTFIDINYPLITFTMTIISQMDSIWISTSYKCVHIYKKSVKNHCRFIPNIGLCTTEHSWVNSTLYNADISFFNCFKTIFSSIYFII